MIKIAQLREMRPAYRFGDAEGMTLNDIQRRLEEAGTRHNVPMAFASDQVKSGSILNREIEDCLVLYHPQHPWDYYRVAIRIKWQGSIAFVYVNDYGESRQINKHARSEAAKNDRRGKALSYKVGSAAASGLLNLGKNKNKLEQEQMWYAAISDIFDEVIS